MSWQTVKLGEWCPDNDIARRALWLRAVDDFLWPTVAAKRAAGDLRGGVVFGCWADWHAVANGLFLAGASSRYRKESNDARLPPDWTMRQAGQADDLDIRWRDGWKKMVVPDGNGRFLPGKKQGLRGMKFCIVHLVLMYGLHDGFGPGPEGSHQLTTWGGVAQSASLLLSLACLRKVCPESPLFQFEWPRWHKVSEMAIRAKVPGRTDHEELEGHRPDESIEGFGKRLAAVMDPRGWCVVKKLAAEFLMPKREEDLAEWRDNQGLIRLEGQEVGGWFRLG